jgi:hypothetical protein
MEKPPCSTCRILKGHLWTDEKCAECLPPLMNENEEAARIYMIVQNQFIMGSGGPVAINQLAIHEAMRLYKIQNRKECFEKVLALAAHCIEKITRQISERRNV